MSNIPFTLDQLKILKAISTEGSFKKAAQRLYISQPAVSIQVQNLEKQLNIALFYRNKRKAELTETGKILINYCERILNLCEETCRALDELNTLQSGGLIIGASQTTGTYLMPRLLGIFRHKYPKISVELQIYSTRKIAWGVANGRIDLAIVGGEVPYELKQNLKTIPYAEDELALILPLSHPFASLEFIQKEDLYRLRFIALNSQSTIRNVIESTLYQNGIDSSYFRIEMELNSIEAIKNAVHSGLGAAFVSVSAISKELELDMLHWAKIEGITIKRTLSILLDQKRFQTTATKIFKEEILDMFLTSATTK